MTALLESGVFDDFEQRPATITREFGMIPVERLDEFTLSEDFAPTFDQIQALGPIDEVTHGRLIYVLRTAEENGNEIVSVVRYEKAIKNLRSSSFKIDAFSIIRCRDGVLRGEKHTAKHFRMPYGNGAPRISEYEDTVEPLTTDDIVLMEAAAGQVMARKKFARFVLNRDIA